MAVFKLIRDMAKRKPSSVVVNDILSDNDKSDSEVMGEIVAMNLVRTRIWTVKY